VRGRQSLGSQDPALLAHPDLPRVFVFHEPLLAGLRLSGKRLIFLAQALAELDCEVLLGDPVVELAGRRLAAVQAATLGCVELVHSRFPLGGFLLQIAGQIGTSRAGGAGERGRRRRGRDP